MKEKDKYVKALDALALVFENITEMDLKPTEEYEMLNKVRSLETDLEFYAEENGIEFI